VAEAPCASDILIEGQLLPAHENAVVGKVVTCFYVRVIVYVAQVLRNFSLRNWSSFALKPTPNHVLVMSSNFSRIGSFIAEPTVIRDANSLEPAVEKEERVVVPLANVTVPEFRHGSAVLTKVTAEIGAISRPQCRSNIRVEMDPSGGVKPWPKTVDYPRRTQFLIVRIN
jgi:hypothetical protein